jgi:hypothetical protein
MLKQDEHARAVDGGQEGNALGDPSCPAALELLHGGIDEISIPTQMLTPMVHEMLMDTRE